MYARLGGIHALLRLVSICRVKNTNENFVWKDDTFFSNTSTSHAEAKFLITHCTYNLTNDSKSPDFIDTLFVVSPYKNRFRYSRPCTNCILLMRYFGIVNVVYSTGDSKCPYMIENVADMQLIKKSRGDRV